MNINKKNINKMINNGLKKIITNKIIIKITNRVRDKEIKGVKNKINSRNRIINKRIKIKVNKRITTRNNKIRRITRKLKLNMIMMSVISLFLTQKEDLLKVGLILMTQQ
jgi:hypothetical protein